MLDPHEMSMGLVVWSMLVGDNDARTEGLRSALPSLRLPSSSQLVGSLICHSIAINICPSILQMNARNSPILSMTVWERPRMAANLGLG